MPTLSKPNESPKLYPVGTIKLGANKSKWVVQKTINGVKKWARGEVVELANKYKITVFYYFDLYKLLDAPASEARKSLATYNKFLDVARSLRINVYKVLVPPSEGRGVYSTEYVEDYVRTFFPNYYKNKNGYVILMIKLEETESGAYRLESKARKIYGFHQLNTGDEILSALKSTSFVWNGKENSAIIIKY